MTGDCAVCCGDSGDKTHQVERWAPVGPLPGATCGQALCTGPPRGSGEGEGVGGGAGVWAPQRATSTVQVLGGSRQGPQGACEEIMF